MPSRIDKLHIYICLVAALAVTVVCIVRGESLYLLSIWVTLSIVIFYIIGQIVRLYIVNKIFPKPGEEAAPEDGEDIDIALDADIDESLETADVNDYNDTEP